MSEYCCISVLPSSSSLCTEQLVGLPAEHVVNPVLKCTGFRRGPVVGGHVLSLPYDLNILVLDTEVYSNTGGQASKSTPVGAAAKFAASGKTTQKKDLGLMAMSYRNAYVASIAFGSNDNQTVKALVEAESYPGPSLTVAYSHCIAHGYDLRHGLDQQKLAVDSGVWPLYRYDPRLATRGQPALQIDSPPTHKLVKDYLRNESRFAMVGDISPQHLQSLSDSSVHNTAQRLPLYKELAHIALPTRTSRHS